MERQLRDLIEIIHFTENVSAKIHGLLDEAAIYRKVNEEFAKSKRYAASILLLTDDGSKLRIAETSIAPDRLEAGEKVAGVRLQRYKIDVQKSSIYSQVVREGKTVQVNVSDMVGELFPKPLAYLISKTMGYEQKPCILTPLKRRGNIIGVLAMSSADLAEYFSPSVRNLAQHISTALELADEQAERKRAEQALQRAHNDLERRVKKRTTDLILVNEQLEQEITERKQAEEVLRQRTAQLEAVRQVGLEIAAELDLDALLHSMVLRAVELVGATEGALYLYRPDWDVLGLVMAVGSHLPRMGTVIHLGEGLCGKVWETGEPLIVDDYQQWEGRVASDECYPWTAVVGVPVYWGEKFLGVLEVLTDTPHTFSLSDAELLSLFATQAAIAIRNVTLFEGEQEHRELAEALAEAAAVVSSTLDPDQVLDRILEEVSRVVPNDAANIMLIEDDQARVVRCRGYERFGTEELVSTLVFHIPETVGFQQIIESKEPIVVSDTANFPGWVQAQEWVLSYAAAPIVVRGEVIGFLNVDGATPGFFTQADAQTLRVFADHAAVAIENAQLYEHAQRRIGELAGLHELSQAFSAVTDVRETYGELTKRMAQLIGCQACTIATYDHQSREMQAQPPGYGAPDEVVRSFRYSVDGPVRDAWNFRLQGNLLVNDITQLPVFFSRWLRGFDVFNLLIVPMALEGRITGLVYAANKPGGFAEGDSKLLTIFASQAAVIIENARLYQETRRWAEEMTSVYNIGVTTTSTLSLDDVLHSVCQQVSRLMKVSTFYIALYDRQKDELRFELALDEGVPLAKFARKLANGAGLSGWIVQSKQPLLIRDAEKGELPVGAIVVGLPARSWLGVPLLSRDQVVGVMGVQSYQPNAFDEEDQRLLSTIAAQVATAIENARLFTETNGRAKDLALLLGTSTAISSSLDLDQILKTVARQIIASLVATLCRITLLDETGENLVIRAVYPIREQEEEDSFGRRCPLMAVPWHRQVIQTGEPLILRQDVPELALSDEECELILTEGVQSAALIPLIVGGRVLGVISLGEERSWERSPFTPEKVKLCQSIAAQAAVAIENAHLYEELQQSFLQTISALAAAVDAKDYYTGGHSQRTTELAAATAEELGLSNQEIELIRYAGLLHDVGKIGISEQILLKPGPLDEAEWEVVRRHPALGASIVERAASLQELVPIILHHHEHYDGEGYPEGLAGETIPLKARILAVADAYEAMTSDRAYRPAMSVEQALDTLREGANRQWDGKVVGVLCRIIQEEGEAERHYDGKG